MLSLDQATQDLAFRAHLLLNDLDGLAFVAAVDSSTDARAHLLAASPRRPAPAALAYIA
ncbi:hypothetical protein S101447_01114 [Acetobacter ascendens]|uniref:Uncharacterized protein n=1 Tax=Acetobacter ascendens TaxID=481146 RepID=A0A1Y0UWB7_9PROT|nr:hypothetical protein S101447_01114 [Acetobacter ascendens]